MWKLIEPGRLLVRARPVGVADVALAPDRQHHLERAVAAPVVVDPVGERLRLLRDVPTDDLRHRAPCPVEERVARSLEGRRAEALADLDDAALRRAAAADDRHQVAPVGVRSAGVVEDDVERRLVEDTAVEDLDRRDPDALLPDREGVRDLAAGHLAAHVHHVAEERGERDALALVEDGQDRQPVVAVRDRPLAEVRVVQEDHVALEDLAAEAVDHLGDVRPELADDHLAAGVADHRELVVLNADRGRHGRPPDDLVHLEARVQERVLDQVEGGDLDGGAHALVSSRTDQEVHPGIDPRAVRGEHDGGRVVLLDDRVAVDRHSRLERGPRIRRHVDRSLGGPDELRAGLRRGRILVSLGVRLELGQRDAAGGQDPEVDDLGASVEHEAVQTAVGLAEAPLERGEVERGEVDAVQLDRDLVALPAVAHVEDEANVLVGDADALRVEPVAGAGGEHFEGLAHRVRRRRPRCFSRTSG